MYDDTIAAIATPPGEGGLAVIRLSGADALKIVAQIFHPLRPGPLRPYRIRYGHIVDPLSHALVDEAMAAFMRAPRSFTREDVVELSLHAGPLPAQTTLRLCLAAGARLARPGEFTMRAFLNGRIDLSQAEATLDVIRAQTDAALALAQAQLGGWLAQEIRTARAALLEALAYVTVMVDFPEDEVAPQDVGPLLRAGLATVEMLLSGADQGMLYRQGARIALVGRPNVGKSSLLNALLRADRAIVTPIPGTTRDTLEESANLAGIPVVLIDTAGIHASPDLVERLGIERSRAAIAQADLALLVLDATTPPGPADQTIAELIGTRPCILVWNKIDQGLGEQENRRTGEQENRGTGEQENRRTGEQENRGTGEQGNRRTGEQGNREPSAFSPQPSALSPQPSAFSPQPAAFVSAHTGQGLAELAQTIAQHLLGGAPPAAAMARLVSNPRHHDALRRAHEHLAAALAGYEAQHPTDLLAGDLTAALNALGEITGESVGDDLLDIIFSRFCIGK